MSYETRTASVVVVKKDKQLFDETSTHITIVDEGAGEFLEICQPSIDSKELRLDANEWPEIKKAVDRMFAEIKAHEKKGG